MKQKSSGTTGALFRSLLAALLVGMFLQLPVSAAAASDMANKKDLAIALDLATLLRAARTVVSNNQNLINDAKVGNKGLTGKAVLEKAVASFRKTTGVDPRALGRKSRRGRLLGALMDSIVDVMDENQKLINHKGVGFKGFVPAVFARLVNEHFKERIGHEAEIKVTAPPNLVRNLTARPDAWERHVIKDEFGAADWPKGKIFSANAEKGGRPAFRVLVPEYYSAACLSCHGAPKGAIDITGYPKEGGKLGDLGGAISISLFR